MENAVHIFRKGYFTDTWTIIKFNAVCLALWQLQSCYLAAEATVKNTCQIYSQIAKFMRPTWGPPGSCRPRKGPMLASWTLLSRFCISSHSDILSCMAVIQDTCKMSLQWRHNGHDSVSNQQPYGCLLDRLFRRRSKKPSKLRATGFCAGNPPETGEFLAQMTSNAENASIWWRHRGYLTSKGYHIITRWRKAAVKCYPHNESSYSGKTASSYRLSPFDTDLWHSLW